MYSPVADTVSVIVFVASAGSVYVTVQFVISVSISAVSAVLVPVKSVLSVNVSATSVGFDKLPANEIVLPSTIAASSNVNTGLSPSLSPGVGPSSSLIVPTAVSVPIVAFTGVSMLIPKSSLTS